MKQHITQKQVMELSNEALIELINYSNKKGWDGPVIKFKRGKSEFQLTTLSIGQMIEYVSERKKDIHIEWLEHDEWGVSSCLDEGWEDWKRESELCDALWEAVKEILEK